MKSLKVFLIPSEVWMVSRSVWSGSLRVGCQPTTRQQQHPAQACRQQDGVEVQPLPLVLGPALFRTGSVASSLKHGNKLNSIAVDVICDKPEKAVAPLSPASSQSYPNR